MNSFISSALLFSSLQQTHPTNPCKMTSGDSFWNSPNIYFDFGPFEAQYDENEQPCLPNHDQFNSLSPMPTGSRKRNPELISENFPEDRGKGTKKLRRCRTFSTCESSASGPKTKEEYLKEFVEERSVPDLLKIFKDRIHRRIKNDKTAYMEAFMFFISAEKIRKFFPRFMDTLELIKNQWPVRSDLEGIKENMKEIDSQYKQTAATYQIKRRLFEVGMALEALDEQRRKDAIKVKNLDAIFTRNEEVSDETLRKALSEAFPWFVLEETATNGPTTVDQNQASLGILEQLQVTFRSWEKELYAMDNNQVGYSDFPGLEEALKKADWGELPDYLKPSASKIEKAIENPRIQVLVCAAIQEMENLSVENLNWDSVKKWGATLNMAKQHGVHVEFADDLLKKNFYAYCGYLTKSYETEI